MQELLDATSERDSGPKQFQPLRGVLILWVIAIIHALSLGVCMWGISQFLESDFLLFVGPIAVLMPALVTMGFALTIPLLWIPGVVMRSVISVTAPIMLWGAFLLGMLPIPDSGMDVGMCREVTSVFLMSLIGATATVGIVMWLFQWRIHAPGYGAPPSPIGIIDLMAVTAFGATVFAFLRQWGPYVDESVDIKTLLLLTVFYGSFGSVSSLTALLAMRVNLGVDGRPLRPANVSGIGLSVAAVAAVWALPMFTDGSPVRDPVRGWLVLSAVTWLIAATTAYVICRWLRRYQFVLTNAAIERSLQREELEYSDRAVPTD